MNKIELNEINCHERENQATMTQIADNKKKWAPFCVKNLLLFNSVEHWENFHFISSQNLFWKFYRDKYPEKNYKKFDNGDDGEHLRLRVYWIFETNPRNDRL